MESGRDLVVPALREARQHVTRFDNTLRNLALKLVGCQCHPDHPCDTCADAITKRDKILQRHAATRNLDYYKPEGASL